MTFSLYTDAHEYTRLATFFARLANRDFDTLTRELPASPTRSTFLDTTETVRPTPTFASLEEMQKTATDAIAASQRRFQPLTADPRQCRAPPPTPENVQSPHSPERHVATQATREEEKAATLEAVGVCEEQFARAAPRRTGGTSETAVVEAEEKEDIPVDWSPPSLTSEILATSFMRELNQRAYGYMGYMGERELDVSEGIPMQLEPTRAPTFSREELLGSIVAYGEAARLRQRRHPNHSLDTNGY